MKMNKWSKLFDFFLTRLKSPLKHPEFIFYFILAIIGVGAIGVYTAIFANKIPGNHDENVISNIASYFLAIIVTGAMALIFNQERDIKRSIQLISIIMILINVLLFYLCIMYSKYVLAFVGIFISLVFWWIGNADNNSIIEDSNYNDTLEKEGNKTHGKHWK